MLTDQQKAALSLIAWAAVKCETETGLPAELTAAQCIFESAWLARAPGNNCFGIMPDHHGSGVQYCQSKEFLDGTWVSKTEAFEKYDSLSDCFADHARLLISGAPYLEAWRDYLDCKKSAQDHPCLDDLVQTVGRVYGTDPNYAEKIRTEIHSFSLNQALAEARSKLNSSA